MVHARGIAEGPRQEIRRALPHGSAKGGIPIFPGEHHHGHFGPLPPQPRKKAFPVLIHQGEIAKHEISTAARELRKPRGTAGGAADLEAIALEGVGKPAALVVRLIDDEHPRLHTRALQSEAGEGGLSAERNEAVCGECRMTLACPED